MKIVNKKHETNIYPGYKYSRHIQVDERHGYNIIQVSVDGETWVNLEDSMDDEQTPMDGTIRDKARSQGQSQD